jgi:hypothetical protein
MLLISKADRVLANYKGVFHRKMPENLQGPLQDIVIAMNATPN